MNHPFSLLQKKKTSKLTLRWPSRARPLTALSDRSYTGQPLCKFSLAFWSHVAAAALNHGSFPCNPKGCNNLPFDEDFIVALTAMNHGGRGSASLIGALQVRMHLQRDMNCMKSKATNAIYATLYSEGNFRVLFTQWHESPRWVVIWHHKRKQFVIILRSSLLAAKPKPIDLFYLTRISFSTFLAIEQKLQWWQKNSKKISTYSQQERRLTDSSPNTHGWGNTERCCKCGLCSITNFFICGLFQAALERRWHTYWESRLSSCK